MVTVRSADSIDLRHVYAEVGDGALTIELPDGAHTIELSHPVRARVELGAHRAGRWTPPPRPQRPRWRDDSQTFMWLRWLRTERESRRLARRRRGGPGQ
ncbi:hypothetical protein BJF78_03505 [Pseudonocardia sp. CNS-139]|nr:hypothetical protein BJF78_03505 [Pseudonocardia sp. CNS-139]